MECSYVMWYLCPRCDNSFSPGPRGPGCCFAAMGPGSCCTLEPVGLTKRHSTSRSWSTRGGDEGRSTTLWPEHMADLTKQTRRRKASFHVDDDLSPKNYLQGGRQALDDRL